MEILNLLNHQLVNVLKRCLPAIEPNWWQSLVLEKLTFQQKTFAANLPPDTLEQLDLSALLRIADQNWYDLTNQATLSKDARNWLKEAQSIRNRWAHAPTGGLPDDIYYRDLDTIERLLQAFGADAATLDKISQYKKDLLLKLAAVEASIQNSIANIVSLGVVELSESILKTSTYVSKILPIRQTPSLFIKI